MLHDLFTDARKSLHLSQNRHVAVHFALNLHGLCHLEAVGLESAVEVVQVDSAHFARSPVEQLGGQGLRQRVVALLLPSANQVVALFANHAHEVRNLVGAVLQVGVHGDDHVALGRLKSDVKRSGLALIAPKANSAHLRVLGR